MKLRVLTKCKLWSTGALYGWLQTLKSVKMVGLETLQVKLWTFFHYHEVNIGTTATIPGVRVTLRILWTLAEIALLFFLVNFSI